MVTVLGGGIGGLVAAVTAAERGADVILHEAHHALGGRWRTTDPPYAAHEGPHVVYSDGVLSAWLKQRGLLGQVAKVPLGALRRFSFHYRGRLRTGPPRPMLRALISRARAPVDRSYRDWATERFGAEAAGVSAAAAGVGVFHFDPGELSAAFVYERFRRVFSLPPAASYRIGGGGAMINDLAAHARRLGVRIELGSRIADPDDVREGPVIVATELESAQRLLNDPALDWPSGRTALLDLGLVADRRDVFVISDLDHAGWAEMFSVPDPSLAPEGASLMQMQMPLKPDEAKADGVARLESLADLGLPGWRDRVRFRREGIANGRTGAVDPPGASWRDRPAIERGDDVYLVGDRVAAPGLLSEVSVNSAVTAAELAVPN